ncbi:MAG: hypothetical protein AB7E95_09190 [Kiritimatiellales bacterium]
MNTIVKADFGDIIIPILVGAFWIIAQIAGAAAKKKQPPRPTRQDSEKPVDDPFAELMRRLSGEQPFAVQHPEEPDEPEFLDAVEEEEPEPPPLISRRSNNEIRAIHNLPDIQPLRRDPPAPEPIAPPVEIPEMDLRPKMSQFRTSIPSIKLPALDLNFQTLEKTGGKFPTFGKIIDRNDRQSLRRAMLSHIIFSKPKALGNWKNGVIE